jgi:predicted MFS family arabinose efflux permease
LLTGVLYAAGSATVVFGVIVVIEVVIIVAWLVLRIPATAKRVGKQPTALSSMWEGLRYVAHHRVVLLLLAFGLLSLLFIQSYAIILTPIAQEKFGIGDEGYGLFLSVAGAGAVLGPLLLAFLGDIRAKGALVVGSMAASGLVLVGIGLAPYLLPAMALVGVLGMFDSSQRVLTNSLLLTQTDREYHGRVVSLYLLDRGFVPIGSLLAGFLMDSVGPSAALGFMGGALIVSVLVLAAAQPRFLTAR